MERLRSLDDEVTLVTKVGGPQIWTFHIVLRDSFFGFVRGGFQIYVILVRS